MNAEQKGSTPAPVPFFRRPFFWVFLGIFAGLGLAAFIPGCQPEKKLPPTAVLPADLLGIQEARNKSLEEELERLKLGLTADPCSVPAILGETNKNKPLPGIPVQPEGNKGPESQSPAPPSTPGGNSTQRLPGQTEGSLPPIAQPPKANTVGELLEQSTVLIISMQEQGIGMGTGFFVAPGIIATNRHVIGQSTARIFVANKLLHTRPATLIASSTVEDRDYALLRLETPGADKIPFLRIADGAARTDRVSAWGYPALITSADPKFAALMEGNGEAVPEIIYSEGVVSVVLEKTPPIIVHTAPISQGNSGGPLVDANGVVVGINTLIRMASKDSYSQSGIALVGKDLKLFMQEQGIAAAPLGQ